MPHSDFRDNVVILTGASSGIGKELALLFAGRGARLTLAARNEPALHAVAAECRARGGSALVVRTDVTDKVQCRRLIDQTVQAHGRIDTLVNNAGIGMWARVDQMQDPSAFERVMQVNYLGSAYCTYYALAYLKQTRGRIVAVSSLAGKTGVPARSGYAASKHALVGFFDSLRIEVAPAGVTVTLAYPDFVATGARFRNLGADGQPVVNAPPYAENTMTGEACARLIMRGIARRQREVFVNARGRLSPFAKLLAPTLVDRAARRATEKGA
jgi:NAD(P)-dependent dehydrogenase (short-subunit alcohol dehydrogenase family)